MGQEQHSSSAKSSQKASRFPLRPCLRKGCRRTFVPGHWNQRYCREPDCLHELHRWQAAKRQRRHRRHPDNRRQHAEAERCRRRRQREQRRVALATLPPPSRTPDLDQDPAPRAWSRSANVFQDFCNRPGCPRRRDLMEEIDLEEPDPGAYDRFCNDIQNRLRDGSRRLNHFAAISGSLVSAVAAESTSPWNSCHES